MEACIFSNFRFDPYFSTNFINDLFYDRKSYTCAFERIPGLKCLEYNKDLFMKFLPDAWSVILY